MAATERKLKTYSVIWQILFVLILIIGATFFIPKIRVPNLLNFEFSDNLLEFQRLLKDQETPDDKVLIDNHKFDFIFIFFYTLFFLVSCVVYKYSVSSVIPKFLFILCFIPGICDVIENYFFIELVKDPECSGLFFPYWLAVRSKWFTVIPFVLISWAIFLYYIVEFLNFLFGKRDGKDKSE